jgi:hypothetical protein
MHMHRGYFAKSMEDYPDDPLASKYSPSVLAVYDAACSFIGLMKTLHSQFPVIERMWFFISPIVSCAVRILIRSLLPANIWYQIVLGALASKSQLAIAPSALGSLEAACQLFERMSGSSRSSKILVGTNDILYFCYLPKQNHCSIAHTRETERPGKRFTISPVCVIG